jgi:hypothetical protein
LESIKSLLSPIMKYSCFKNIARSLFFSIYEINTFFDLLLCSSYSNNFMQREMYPIQFFYLHVFCIIMRGPCCLHTLLPDILILFRHPCSFIESIHLSL